MQNYPGLSYLKAVIHLLDGEQGRTYEPAPRKKEEPEKEFIQSLVGQGMWRLHTYPLKRHLVDREVLNTFVRVGLVYEDEKYHNAVLTGKGEHGAVRHAHRRGTSDMGKTFRISMEGSDPRYSFHWNRTSDRLYVFEVSIDPLFSLTLYSKNWQWHNYVALCGMGGQATLWMLEQAPGIRCLILCLDYDVADIETTGRLKEILRGWGYSKAVVPQSTRKDWNENVRV